MRKLVLVACAVLVTGSCAQQEKPTTAPGEAKTTRAASQTLTVAVDWNQGADKEPLFYLGYFPSTVTARPGDTVEFKQMWTGEPHSVTMGTLVDKGLAAAPKGPSGSPGPDYAALPVMIPEGPGDANQIAVNPCYLATGTLPKDATKPCPRVAQPDFTGTQAYYNSGFLSAGSTFKIKLAEGLAPGTYKYYCNLHGAVMSGAIDVKAKGSAIPAPDAVMAAGKKEATQKLASTETAYKDAEANKTPYSKPETVLGGYGDPSSAGGLLEFFPDSVTTKAGEKITWVFFGGHTLTFNPPADVGHPIVKGPDGNWHMNPKAMGPAGSPGVNPAQGGPPASGLPQPVITDGGSYDGSGFRNSGFIPPGRTPLGYSLTFTKAGSFRYSCLVHPAMTGTVDVS
jgi:plastocyanin